MTKHKISVIVPVYNCAEWLAECVDSIVRQNLPDDYDLQLILVDDGSSDGSEKICDALAHGDERVLVIHQLNAGVSMARNSGLDASDGDWICFVDGDDVLADGTFEVLAELYVADHDIVRFGTYSFGKSQEPTSYIKGYSRDKDEFTQLVVRRTAMLGVWGAFYKRELFTENNIRFQQGIRTGEDWMILFKLLIRAKTFIYIDKELYGYRINESSVTRRLISEVRPDTLIAHNHIIECARNYGWPISSKDIAIARSDMRRKMMKAAILNKNKTFYMETDEVLKKYAPQSFWKDVWYSREIKHKVGFIVYWCMDKLYRLVR